MRTRSVPALLAGCLILVAAPLGAQTVLPPVTLGAGVQTSSVHTSPDGGDSVDQFVLNSVRFYVNGPVTDKIKFMFNAEYDGAMAGRHAVRSLRALDSSSSAGPHSPWVASTSP